MALAMALSKSIYLETPLPVIPGLSSQKPQQQEVLAHPHRDVSVSCLLTDKNLILFLYR